MTKAHLNDFVRSRPGIARFVPNSVTALALCCGLVSIRFSIEQQFDHAIAAIIIAAVLDGIDGRLARKLEACSRFGEEFDSLADFLSFGVAPVVLLFFWSEEHMTVLLSVSLMVFVVASATRLARFNAQAAEPGARWRKAYFTGLPTPSAALAVLLPVSMVAPGPAGIQWAAAYTLVIALLMVSTVPTFSGKTTSLALSAAMRAALVVAAALAMTVVFLFPRQALVVFTVVYLASIPVSWLQFRRQRRMNEGAVLVPPQSLG